MKRAVLVLISGTAGIALLFAATASAGYEDCGNTKISGAYDLPMKVKNMGCGGAQNIAHRYFEKIRNDYPPRRGEVEFVKKFRCKWKHAYAPFKVAWVCRHRTKKKALKTFYPPENVKAEFRAS